ncbi:outer membrane beta-barrel protein [Colwellia sp. MB02u-10]|uniref:outer membrane beta-barrel protein n=1 Tax=Colwellia sp. MB02u-10 TaxID=2759828 RepID=UPI0015F415AF|nr:outer membrane beta-barrel protein [Colwellia sp. MB02u-10]MBA6342946.1 outer membrane beta-barrel protein [Colwellia sp. MB02u-10]
MFKKSLIALSLLVLPLTASANWSAGAGYADLSLEKLSLGAIYGAVAYEFIEEGSKFSLIPELRLGAGISDDKSHSIKVEVERFTALSVRGQYNYDNGFYVYVMPSYANLDLKASFRGASVSDDEWEFGFGAGVGKKLNEKVSVEASFERYDTDTDTDVITVGFKYAF